MAPASPNLFDRLPARPPTPPRDIDQYINEALEFLSDSFEVDDAAAQPAADPPPAVVNTPPQQSPSSSAEHANHGSSRRKKVDFSPWTAFHSANDFASRRGNAGSPLRPLPQPRDPKTLKGILKPHDPPPTVPSDASSPGQPNPKYDNFATMLEAMAKQLAGRSRPHKLDSYITLLHTLKAYEGSPDTKLLVDKIGLLAQFIRRDVVATNGDTGTLDLQLAAQALKLLVALMQLGSVGERIPDDFRAFFLDKSIEAFGDSTAPKKWVNHLLFAFSEQQFGRAMTAERANSALTALQDIEDRVSGNNVAICRIAAYQKLLNQVPQVMVARAPDWLPHVFHALLSSFKDLRERAIGFGNEAGVTVGDIPQISRAVMDILAKEIDGGGTYGDFFSDRLGEMLDDGQTAQHVPHIWAVIVLLLRSRRKKLESWPLLRKWLETFQKCLNGSNKEVAIQANAAWNRFVYAIRPDATTSTAFRSLLRQAIVAQFTRSGLDRDTQRLRRSAFSSYFNLLYYALPPTATAEQLDLYWQEFVAKVFSGWIKKDRRASIMACKVLATLFKKNSTKIWRENLAFESASLVSLDNLIGLEPRWIRQRLGTILQLVEPCLATASWDLKSPSQSTPSEPAVKTMWIGLMGAVADAGRQEVTVSMEFKEACAHIMNLFSRLWTKYPRSLGQEEGSEQVWIDKFAFLVQTAVEVLGPGPFADPILARNPTGDFEVAPTPSHRPKARGAFQSPVLHLLHLFTTSAPVTIETSSLLCLAEQVLSLCCNARPSRMLKLDLLCSYVRKAAASSHDQLKSGIWRKSAREVESLFHSSYASSSMNRASQQLGEEYRSVISILTCGLSYDGDDDVTAASRLFESFVAGVHREVGQGVGYAATALAVTEPLSELLQNPGDDSNPNTVIHIATLTLNHTEHPKHRKAVDQARKILWGVSTGPQKPADFDPYNYLYSMTVVRLQRAYEELENLNADLVIQFSMALCELCKRWPVSFAALLLRKTQDGIAVWVEDPEQKLAADTEEIERGRAAVYNLWNIVMTTVERLPRKDSRLLEVLEILIASGFCSKRQRIVNRTIEMWNTTFGTEESLQYPAKVEKALRSLRRVVELPLPDFPDDSNDETDPELTFIDSQQDVVPKQHPRLSHRPSPLSRRFLDAPSSSPAPQVPTPSRREQSSSASDTKPRANLRHDDSQVEFAPIDSSPKANSQLFTDHQKEVRERQRTDVAAMFPDISSSPARQAKEKQTTLPAYGQSGKRSSAFEDAEPHSTPILGPQEYGGPQDVPSSSPTPKSRNASQDDSVLDPAYITSSAAERMFDTEIPSSPPRLDDENELPADSSIVQDSFEEHGFDATTTNTTEPGVLQDHLDDELAAQLIQDVSHLSDAKAEDYDRQSPPVSISSAEQESDSEPASSDIEEEVSQQLTNEVIAQALRLSQSGGGHFSSFAELAELPQGTAGTAQEDMHDRIVLDEMEDAPSPTEKDTSSPEPAVEPVGPELPVDETVVEDSFAHLDAKNARLHSGKKSTVRLAQNPPKSSRRRKSGSPTMGKKRKSWTPADGSKASKRSKNTSSPATRPQEPAPSKAPVTSEDEDSDDSMLSNIFVDTSSLDGPESKAMATLTSASDPELLQRPESIPEMTSTAAQKSKNKKALKALETASSSQRTSRRLSGAAADPTTGQFRKRKSRLSESQTTEADPDETRDVSAADEDMTEEAPAPKKKRGRPSRRSDSQNSSQTSNVGFTSKKHVRGRISDSPSQDATRDASERDDNGAGSFDRGSVASKAKSEPVAQHKKRKSYDKGGAGATAASSETQASTQQAAAWSNPSASQGSTTSNGNGISVSERPKLQPKSIIERLRRILADCKQVVLGREDERELDNIMFEVRREVHAAARRGDDRNDA